jgi:hypothetical protein
MAAEHINALQAFAIEQGNRLQITYCPHTPEWKVSLGLFAAEHENITPAMDSVLDQIRTYRAKQSS